MARGSIIGPMFKATLRAVKQAAGLTPWPRGSVLRHCFGSYWLSVNKDRAHLAEILGNSLAVIRSNYRRAIPEEIAKAYWHLSFSQAPTADIIPIAGAA
jgi:hypothetical protein